MGVSHSKSDEFVVDGRFSNKKMASKSTKIDAKNNNCIPTKRYMEKPRSVSSNDVLENTENNNTTSSVQASSSSNSITSNLRTKMGSLRKPSIKFKSSTNNLKNDSAKSTLNTDNAVVQSFMTNISSVDVSNNFFSYPYPRVHSTNLVLPLHESTIIDSSTTFSGSSGIRRPIIYRNQYYGRTTGAVLQIPSPVASVSEPSASEENLSVDIVENSEADTKGSNVRMRYVDSPSQYSASNSHVDSRCLNALSLNEKLDTAIFETLTSAGTDVWKPYEDVDIKAAGAVTNQPLVQGATQLPDFRKVESPTALLKTTRSISDSRVAFVDTQGLSVEKLGEHSKYEDKDITQTTPSTTLTEEGKAVGGNVKRPNTLTKSFTEQQVHRASWKLRWKGEAPLAESESFIVENSPAVELPPVAANNQFPLNSMTSPSRIPTRADNNNLNELGLTKEDRFDGPKSLRSQGSTHIPMPTRMVPGVTMTAGGTRFQSRLKNPNGYEQRQRFIYGKYSVPTVGSGVGSEAKKYCGDAGDQISLNAECPKIDAGPVSSKDALDKAIKKDESSVTVKPTLQDSGVRVDIGSSGSDSNGSKATSPEGSLHRGLIDDEIRDQPELTFGKSDPSVADQPSQITTIQEEILQTDFGGPVRFRDRNRKRPSATGGKMIESYDSTVSSLSVDSDDLMIDYESLDLVEEEEKGMVAPTAGFDNSSLHSSLGRRSSRNSAGSTVGNWPSRKPINLALGVKRSSMDAMIDELSSLKNETEKVSNQSQQRPRTLSDFPSPSSVTGSQQSFSSQSPSHYNRILRPPLSLECAGLSTISLDQQTYRHVVQDVTVMKTLLLRLKRALQEAETTNPFESSLYLKNGLTKSALVDAEMQKNEELTKDDLEEENSALRTQVAVMRQQLEEQNRIIQCLQSQLKQCRQRSFRKAESFNDQFPVKDVDVRKDLTIETKIPGAISSKSTMNTDV